MAKSKRVRYVFGSRTNRWHKITQDDKDWKFGYTKSQMKKKIASMQKAIR